VTLAPDSGEISEVVVTALGIRRERRALGYSVTEVKGDELTQAREINLANSLVGRVPGLNVSSVAGGPGASTNVIIRGISSLSSSNQPLYVINGVPMESAPNGQPGTQWDNGVDRGDAIGNLNPDDIETISVLKGAAASALYGYRAKAGVILITTKKARADGIEFNSNYVAEKIMDPTDWQYEYGQGADNMKPASELSAFQSGQSSWGGKLDGSSVIQFDGVSRPYIAQKDNLEKFYRTGGTFTNTIAFNKVFTDGALRLSANDLHNNAVIPNSGLNRQSFNLTGVFTVFDRLVIDARANYILEQAKNRPFLSDGPGNSNYNVMFLPSSVDVDVLKKRVNDDGSEYGYSGNTFATNPWFAAYNYINDTKRDRLIASTSVRYNSKSGYFVQGRIGRDSYNDRYTGVVPTGTAYRPNGSISEETIKFTDLNVDGLVGKTFKVNNDLNITPNIGASYRRTKSEKVVNNGSDFAVPFVYNILNAKNKSVDYIPNDIEVQSLYGTMELAYKSFLYLTGSARSDWFSTLATPGSDNQLNVVYPSVSGSFVFSEFVKNNWLSFGKVRAGYAVVGQATEAYKTQLSYSFFSQSLNGLPLGRILNDQVPNSALRPSKATELEVGTELRMFNNRLGVDLTWYNKKSKNEIVFAPASITSGYTSAVLNIGELQNKGFEALISFAVAKGKDFSWTTSVNGSVNNNKVLSLAADQSQLAGGTSRSGVGFTASVVGLPAAQIMAYDYKYDDAGKVVLDANNIPVRGDLVPWGSAYHKWIGGWNNEINYKGVNLSFLIDGKWGGKIFSATDYYGYVFGLHKATLVDREKDFGTPGSPIDAATYYGTLANNVSRLFVQDASFIKLRQIVLGYTFPKSMFGNVVKSLNVSVVARNVATLMKKTDNIDPEGNYSSSATGLTQGLELGGVPPVRSYGINLNVRF
jgi:TonB-linked SusC/RagA family outer membrane protein